MELLSKIFKRRKYLYLLLCALIPFLLQAQQKCSLTISNESKSIVSRYIYGHFSEHLGRCIYDGFYKKGKIRADITEALKKIQIPVLRWPGGCFADWYHWQDGIGPKDKRPTRVNTNWGMVTEDNSFGTHEFLEVCEMIGCEPYLAVNVGSGSAREMAEWVEYLNGTTPGAKGATPVSGRQTTLTKLRATNGHPKPFNVSFFGIGNESWGCGGNMRPEYYCDLYKQFASFCKDYPGTKIKKIAGGAYKDDYTWTETLMKNIPVELMWGLSFHYYIFPGSWEKKGSATNFSESEYFGALKKTYLIDSMLQRHIAIMDKYDPEKKVALVVDEWGIWTDAEPGTNPDFLFQQNSLRDAMIAATALNIFNNHCDRIKMANLAQTVNVLQALILTEGDKMLLTPTYYVFDMYKVHQDAELLPVKIQSSFYKYGSDSVAAVNVSASKDSNGVVNVSFVNLDPLNSVTVSVSLENFKWSSVTGRILTSGKFTDVNTFDKPSNVSVSYFSSARKSGEKLAVELPAKSVVVVTVK